MSQYLYNLLLLLYYYNIYIYILAKYINVSLVICLLSLIFTYFNSRSNLLHNISIE